MIFDDDGIFIDILNQPSGVSPITPEPIFTEVISGDEQMFTEIISGNQPIYTE